MKNRILLALAVILFVTPGLGQEGCQSCKAPSSPLGNLSLDEYGTILSIKNETAKKEEPGVEEIKPINFSGSIFLPLSKAYSKGEKITFWAFASGGKAPYEYKWFSSRDGFLSESKNFSTFDLSLGEHEILLETKDTQDSTSRDSVSIKIKKSPLKVKITSPQDSQVYREGDVINLNYSASGGKKPYTVVWKINGKEIKDEKIRAFPSGPHQFTRIRLEIEDAKEAMISDEVEIFVKELCNQDGICDLGENFKNCPQDCSGLRDNYCDGANDGICDPDCERKLDVDCFCNSDGFCEIELENYGNCPHDCQSGSRDNYCDGVGDKICDQDCEFKKDPDCSKNYFEYGMLLILVLLIFLAYLKLRKFIAEK